jgi:hypothetical protein
MESKDGWNFKFMNWEVPVKSWKGVLILIVIIGVACIVAAKIIL